MIHAIGSPCGKVKAGSYPFDWQAGESDMETEHKHYVNCPDCKRILDGPPIRPELPSTKGEDLVRELNEALKTLMAGVEMLEGEVKMLANKVQGFETVLAGFGARYDEEWKQVLERLGKAEEKLLEHDYQMIEREEL